MPPKRKIVKNSQATADGVPTKQLRPEEFFNNELPGEFEYSQSFRLLMGLYIRY